MMYGGDGWMWGGCLAICLVSVDEQVPEPVLEMVRTLPLVVQATGLAF